jgi:hypothetical protein
MVSEQKKKYARMYYHRNKERMNKYSLEYYYANKEKHRVYNLKSYYKTRAPLLSHEEKSLSMIQSWPKRRKKLILGR